MSHTSAALLLPLEPLEKYTIIYTTDKARARLTVEVVTSGQLINRGKEARRTQNEIICFVKIIKFDPTEHSTSGQLTGNEGFRKRGFGTFDTASDDNHSVEVWLEPN